MSGRTEAPESVELRVWEALATVRDPEIPPIAITDLGIVERVAVDDDRIEVTLLPTFAGCPALDVIRQEVEAALTALEDRRRIQVRFALAPAWTSDRITPQGREALRGHGLAPPGEGLVFLPLASLSPQGPGAACPFCGSRETVLESAFGPTLCRTTHFCRACRNPFEAFKEKGVRPQP